MIRRIKTNRSCARLRRVIDIRLFIIDGRAYPDRICSLLVKEIVDRERYCEEKVGSPIREILDERSLSKSVLLTVPYTSRHSTFEI